MAIGSIVRLLWPLPNFTEDMAWTGKTSVAGVNTNDNKVSCCFFLCTEPWRNY